MARRKLFSTKGHACESREKTREINTDSRTFLGLENSREQENFFDNNGQDKVEKLTCFTMIHSDYTETTAQGANVDQLNLLTSVNFLLLAS